MNILIVIFFIIGLLLFGVGVLEVLTTKNGSLLIAGSILLASGMLSFKLEELKKK